MTFEELKEGQHLWVKSDNSLIMVMKLNNWYEVCGAWECGVDPADYEIVELVNVPKGYENFELPYAS